MKPITPTKKIETTATTATAVLPMDVHFRLTNVNGKMSLQYQLQPVAQDAETPPKYQPVGRVIHGSINDVTALATERTIVKDRPALENAMAALNAALLELENEKGTL